MVLYIGGQQTEDIPLSLPICHSQCSMLRDGLGFTSSFVGALFFLPLWFDFILVWIIEVVCIVLQIIVCLYVSPFSSCLGQRFSILVHLCSFYPVKKCIVLCVKGLLCHVDPSVGPVSPDAPFWNIVQRPSVTKLFMMLLQKFHIGLWSSMTELKLIPLLWHILPTTFMKCLSFIFFKEDCHDYKKYLSYHKMYDTLLRKTASRAVCLENQILFVDIRLISMRHNPVGICYLPYPFVGELHYPNESRVIPNVATDIIPFIYPVHRFASIEEYMFHIVRPGQRHYVAQEHLQRSCYRNTQS